MNRTVGLLGLALAATALVQTASAEAAPAVTAATYCALALGSISADGGHILRGLTATTPPTASASRWGGKNLLQPGQTKLAGGLGFEVTGNQSGMKRRQFVVTGDQMWRLTYDVNGFDGDDVPGTIVQSFVGGGWGTGIRYFESSKFNAGGKAVRQNTYAVQGDKIERWTVVGSNTWKSKASYAGFSAVKTMALISQTATYDTFLANTYSGALYTIRIPVSGAPVVKKVRTSTWQGFETLVASKCGTQGTLLLGIDKETGTPYMYALSHANGAATVIQSLGKVNRTVTEPAYFHYYDDTQTYPQLFGE